MESHFVTLMWKHWITCKRHKIRSVFIILAPLVCITLLNLTIMLLKPKNKDECSYAPIPLAASHPIAFVYGAICHRGTYSSSMLNPGCLPADNDVEGASSVMNGILAGGSKNCHPIDASIFCHNLEAVSRRYRRLFKDEIRFIRLFSKGKIYYYPKNDNTTAIMALVAKKLDAFSKLREIAAALRGEIWHRLPNRLGYWHHIAVNGPMYIEKFLSCFPTSNIGRMVPFANISMAREAVLNTDSVWGIVGFHEIESIVEYKLISHVNYRSSVEALQLQSLVESAIINYRTGEQNDPLMDLQQLPKKCKKSTEAYIGSKYVVALIISFSIILIVVTLAADIAYEKMAGLQEFLMILGVRKWKLFLSWWVYGSIIMVYHMLIVSIGIKLVTYDMFSKTPFMMIFILMELYGVSFVAFIILIGIAIGNPQRVILTINVIMFLGYLTPTFVRIIDNVGYSGGMLVVTRVLSMFSPIAATVGFMYINEYEKVGGSNSFSKLSESPAMEDGYGGICEAYVTLILDTFLYIFLAWYLDKVVQSKYGTKYPVYFPFMPSYWCGTTAKSDGGNHTGADVELMPQREVGVEIQGLTKQYGSFRALNKLSADFYKNEITAFLGHNGAGKSTTMNILTGMLSPSSGTAKICGQDIITDISSIRQSLGFCPQYDVLYFDLNVNENMEFFGCLKGLTKADVHSYSSQIFSKMSMPESAFKTLAKGLSGGMKRKLSIAVAFLGDPKVIILDEPTSAIDPFSRRAIWDVVLSYRSKSTILISTHNMQEADLLGDRIAIINHGELKCFGSAMYLKSRYGSGAKLTVAHAAQFPVDILTEALQQIVPVTLERNATTTQQKTQQETSYSIPVSISQAPEMVTMLEMIDARKKELMIQSYGISEPSLEQVFFEVTDEETSGYAKVPNDLVAQHNRQSGGGSQQETGVNYEPVSGCFLFGMQWMACIAKRYHLARKSTTTFNFQFVAPALLMVLLIALNALHSGMGKTGNVERLIQPWFKEDTSYTFFYQNYSRSDDALLQSIIDDGISIGCLQQPQVNGVSCRGASIPTGLPTNNAVQYDDVPCTCAKECPSNAAGPAPSQVTLRSGDTLLNLNYRNWTEYALKSNVNIQGGFITRDIAAFTTALNSTLKHRFSIPQDGTFEQLATFLNNHSTDSHVRLMGGSGDFRDWLTPQRGFTMSHNEYMKAQKNMKGAILNAANNAFMRIRSGNGNSGIIMHSAEELLSKVPTKYINEVMLSLCAMYAFLIPILIVLLMVVTENNSGSKQLQFLMGLNKIVYWTSTFAWDVFLYLISCGLIVLIMYAASGMLKNMDFESVFAIAVISGINMMLLSYNFSFLFKTARSAVIVVVVIAILMNLAYFVLFYISWQSKANMIMGLEKIKEWEPDVRDWLNLIPSFFAVNALGVMLEFDVKQDGDNLWDNSLYRPLIKQIVFGSVMLVLLILTEFGVWRKLETMLRRRCHSQKITDQSDVELDPDVKAEAEYASTGPSDSTLIVNNIIKIYGTNVAVRNVSFGARNGECFGLLGVNGAGKTTLFKMLAGFIEPSSGDATIMGKSVFGLHSAVAQHISYCPQEDILFETMTPGEHLHFYGKIRGIPSRERSQLVDQLIRDIGLHAHISKASASLSGGNKRKLNFAISLVGKPQVIFLDEMTTGMDPNAKRYAWRALQGAMKQRGCSAVITSHCMEECEALCNRIVIMINGQFHCIGSIQYLKDMFGNKYTAKFRLLNDETELSDQLDNAFVGMKVVEKHPGFVEVEMPATGLKLADLYKKIHELKDEFLIEQFSVSQTTLEDIFVQLARQQH